MNDSHTFLVVSQSMDRPPSNTSKGGSIYFVKFETPSRRFKHIDQDLVEFNPETGRNLRRIYNAHIHGRFRNETAAKEAAKNLSMVQEIMAV